MERNGSAPVFANGIGMLADGCPYSPSGGMSCVGEQRSGTWCDHKREVLPKC